MRLEIYPSRSKNPKQKWRWRLIAANGRKVANSGEGYSRSVDAERAFLTVKQCIQTIEVTS